MNSRILVPALLLAGLISLPPALAQEGPPPQGRREAPAQAQPQHRTLLPADSVTEHEITVAGKKLAYTATAGTIHPRDAQGETTAEIFYVSFIAKDAGDPRRRPVTYLFNGGPGAASAYLDIGATGPRALPMAQDGAIPTDNRVVDNPDTWLAFTDLVYIDPVGTGWSRATDADKAAKEFWGVEPDLDALADAIRVHLAKIGRSSSPIYLAGESYGGFRAARLAHMLATDQGIELSGVVMVSPVIDFGLMSGGPLGTESWALRLPSYAAAKMGDKALEPGALDAVETFALHDYMLALTEGPQDGPAATALYHRLAEFTGIDEQQIARWRGRIPLYAYVRDVQGADGRVVSRYDAGISAVDPNPLAQNGQDDPVLEGTIAPFTTAFVAYAADELGYKTDLPFKLLNDEVGRHWDWGNRGGPVRVVGASDALRRALALTPRLKVMIAHGVADLQTPYMMSRYVRDHLPSPLAGRITLKLYAGGHMLYLHEPSRHRLHDDAAAFYGTGGN
jgi:carboxypeptidase C (cathepsin A)